MSTLAELKAKRRAPDFLTDEGYQTITKGYLYGDEDPKDMYERLANGAAHYLNRPDLRDRFFELLWKGHLCAATPVCSNFFADRGLPISCNSVSVPDSTKGIFDKQTEMAMLSKYGAGVGVYFGNLRSKGTKIKGTGGETDSVVKWAKCYDSTIAGVSQANVRRGAAVIYLPIDHGDIHDFLQMRRPTGDTNTRCLNINHAVCIPDSFMQKAEAGDPWARNLWSELLTLRVETGEPYFLFTDTVNKANPDCYKDKGMLVETSNLCNEIMLYTDAEHTFVCCLSSMNLTKWDEWKDTDAVEMSIYFLDAVMSEYIEKAKKIPGFESAVRFAEKSRAVGLGVLGWHSLLQDRRIPFDSFDSMMLNNQIWRHIKTKAEAATKQLALDYGEPEWCKGHQRRATHLLACAPTVSNSLISGGLSPGIEPIPSNYWVQNSAKGTFVRKNRHLVEFLQEKGFDTPEVWSQINKDSGSVLNLTCLTEDEKKIFLTAREINQFAIIKQASQRQPYIDQGQSVNLFFASNSDPKYIHQVHLEAWRQGLKGLYYCRTESVLRGDLATRTVEECEACSG